MLTQNWNELRTWASVSRGVLRLLNSPEGSECPGLTRIISWSCIPGWKASEGVFSAGLGSESCCHPNADRAAGSRVLFFPNAIKLLTPLGYLKGHKHKDYTDFCPLVHRRVNVIRRKLNYFWLSWVNTDLFKKEHHLESGLLDSVPALTRVYSGSLSISMSILLLQQFLPYLSSRSTYIIHHLLLDQCFSALTAYEDQLR